MDKSFDDNEYVIDKKHSNDENLILYESNSESDADEDDVETKQLSKLEWSFVSNLSCKNDNFFKVFLNGNHLGQIRNSNEEDSKYGIVSPIKELMKKIIKDKDFGPARKHSYLVSNKQKIKEEYNLENFIIPNLVQIRNFKAAYKREIGNNNKIRHVIDFIKTHMFVYNLNDDEIFVFGLKLDNDDEPIIGTGTDDNHSRDKIKEVFNDIDKMHESSSDSVLNCFAKKALAKWRRNNLKSFADHFEKELIEGPFSNWQIYQTPPGYSS
ncbi:unnamed protein product [Brachionus calyciflorus]|uniref:Uncharacterized protein n=1 Tax=Brachionus calyciflorus TaxID=104777 RepID=A0A813Y7V3_9BILA|nr:unnamed protein product [Brachionus calyciflorus]